MRAFVIYNNEKLLTVFNNLGSGEMNIQNRLIKYALVEMETPSFNLEKYPNAVVIKKEAFSCNYRDIGIMLQNHNRLTDRNSWFSIGSEFSGVIVKKGKNVRQFSIGDRVIPNGEYPTKTTDFRLNGLPTNQSSLEFEVLHHKKVVKIPDSMSFEVGAGFTIGSQTAYSMIQKLKIKDHQKGLIMGVPSNTSLFILNSLIPRNIDLYVGARNKTKAENLGIEHKKIFSIPDEVNNLLDIDEIHENVSIYGKFDFIIDPFADANMFRVVDLINMNGKYITCGMSNQFSPELTTIDSQSFVGRIIMNNISILGNCLGSNKCIVDALDHYERGVFNIPIGKVIHDDPKNFMEYTFGSKPFLGKIIFKYT